MHMFHRVYLCDNPHCEIFFEADSYKKRKRLVGSDTHYCSRRCSATWKGFIRDQTYEPGRYHSYLNDVPDPTYEEYDQILNEGSRIEEVVMKRAALVRKAREDHGITGDTKPAGAE